MSTKKEEKKVKLNDKNIKAKKKAMKPEKYISEESREVRKFIIILLSVILIIIAIYGLSTIFIKEEDNSNNNTPVAGKIDYDIVSIGTMLNRPIDEYYVLLYDASDSQAVLYSSIISKYMKKVNSGKIYFCDLGNKLNSDFVSKNENTNPQATKISELALGKLTLIKVNKGNIVKYIEDIDTIKSELGV